MLTACPDVTKSPAIAAQIEKSIKRSGDTVDDICVVSVVGFGDVGLSRLSAFGKRYPTMIDDRFGHRVDSYKRHVDPTEEISVVEFQALISASTTATWTSV